MSDTATTVKADSATSGSGGDTGGSAASVPAQPTTALSAVQAAFKEEATPPSSGGTGDQPPAGDGQPPAAAASAPVVGQPPAQPSTDGGAGIAQLRSAYEALKQKYSRFDNMDIDDVLGWYEERQRFQNDPVAWYRQLGTELGSHPTFSTAMQPPKQDPEPQPDLYTVIDGEKVFSYSAGQQKKWQEWNDRRIDAKWEQRLNPMQEWVTQARNSAVNSQIVEGARTTATNVLNELRQYPHFKEGEAKIAQRLAAMDPKVKKEIGAIAALHLAYSQYLRDDVLPKRDADIKKQMEAEARRKANGSAGTVVPGTGGNTATQNRPQNVGQLANAFKSGKYATAGS